MRTNDFVSTEEVVAEVTEMLSDSEFTHGIGRSMYETWVHRVLEDMSLHMYFNKVTKDIFDWNTCGNGILSPPKNMFNISEIYLFNSSCDTENGVDSCAGQTVETASCDSCSGGGSVNRCDRSCCKNKSCWSMFVQAHWKRMFNKFGSTGIKTAKISPVGVDPVYLRDYTYSDMPMVTTRPTGTLVFCNWQNADIAFSDSAHCYRNVRLVGNGFSSDNCELPIIPRELRNVVVDTVILKACTKLMLYFDEYKSMYQVYKLALYGDNSVQNPGSQLKAERFIKSLNRKQRDDLFEYFGNIDIK